MGQPVQERHGHLLIAKDLRPLSKRQVGGNADAGTFIAITKELEEQLGGGFGKGQVAQLIDQHQVKAPILRQQAWQPQLLMRDFQFGGQRHRWAKQHAIAS